ncbi:MAG: tRNA epoxyqueuosine(34) reductase QueG [Acidobacteria bacterium]|nr:tRNA epoxyqueuosine(34) reductase QueG [Acidobacteriota bacterium]
MTSGDLKAAAAQCGFDLCGIASADRHPRLARLADWIADGHAGEMTYLAKSLDERLDPARVLVSARTVVSLAIVYNTASPYSASVTDPERVSISRYAWGADYHAVFRERLRELLRWMAAAHGPGLEAFSSVDAGPVQERVFAEQAGLGWIGKNTCLINATLGSWLFLGAIITNARMDLDTPPVDLCASCTRCLDACPTGALVEPYRLDATRCLSYLTIELRSSVPAAYRSALHPHVFGCDICQDVCPWNRRAAVSDDEAWQARPGLAYPRLLDLCRWTDEAWSARLRGSAMQRAGLTRIRRSLAFAASRLPGRLAVEALGVLAAHPTASRPDVADAIAWARGAIDATGRHAC